MKGGKGEPRVAWLRPKKFGQERVFDSIPFLNLSRSLGDFWSYNPTTNCFAVSPEPDVHIREINPKHQRFVVIASGGLWTVMAPDEVVRFIWDYKHATNKCNQPCNVVCAIITEALARWERKCLAADNIAVIIAFITEAAVPPAPSVLSQSPSHPTLAIGEDEDSREPSPR